MENRPPNHRLTLRLPPELWEDLRAFRAGIVIADSTAARAREHPYSSLIIRWIEEGLEQEGTTLD
jgi:hypothetical protein